MPNPLCPDWHFDRVTINRFDGGPIITDPNTWTIERVNGLCIISDADGIGQTDFDLIVWGIGWLHADSLE